MIELTLDTTKGGPEAFPHAHGNLEIAKNLLEEKEHLLLTGVDMVTYADISMTIAAPPVEILPAVRPPNADKIIKINNNRIDQTKLR